MPRGFPWRVAAALLPAAFGILGLLNNVHDWREATTVGQHVAGAGVLLYGPLGVAAAILILMGRPLGRTLLIAFSITACIVATIAPVAWGGAPMYSAIFSLFGAGVMCAAAVWAESMSRAPAADAP